MFARMARRPKRYETTGLLRCIQTVYDVDLIYYIDFNLSIHTIRTMSYDIYYAEMKTILIRTTSSVDFDAARWITWYDVAMTRPVAAYTSSY
jgi:hypothetical protein